MNRFIAPLLAIGLGAIPVFAATPPVKDADRCLFSSQVDGYTSPTDDSVVLTSGNRNWRADFATHCTGLRFAEAIGVKSRTTCVTAGDSIRFREAGGTRQSCMIGKLTYMPREGNAAPPAAR